MMGHFKYHSHFPPIPTASLAKWLRRPPRERKIRGSIPVCAMGIFPGRVIPVTSTLALQWLPCQAENVFETVFKCLCYFSDFFFWGGGGGGIVVEMSVSPKDCVHVAVLGKCNWREHYTNKTKPNKRRNCTEAYGVDQL